MIEFASNVVNDAIAAAEEFKRKQKQTFEDIK